MHKECQSHKIYTCYLLNLYWKDFRGIFKRKRIPIWIFGTHSLPQFPPLISIGCFLINLIGCICCSIARVSLIYHLVGDWQSDAPFFYRLFAEGTSQFSPTCSSKFCLASCERLLRGNYSNSVIKWLPTWTLGIWQNLLLCSNTICPREEEASGKYDNQVVEDKTLNTVVSAEHMNCALLHQLCYFPPRFFLVGVHAMLMKREQMCPSTCD